MTSGKTPTLALRFETRIESWPIAGSFTLSRGAKREAVTVVAEVSQDGLTGRGECVPYPRYGETTQATVKTLQSVDALQAAAEPCTGAGTTEPCGPPCLRAARNALDYSVIDLEAKRAGRSAWTILGRNPPRALHHGLRYEAGQVYPPDAALWG